MIKCYILTNSECPSCSEWFNNKYEEFKKQFNIDFEVIDCYKEQQEGRMPFPPLVVPTFYFYKNGFKDFPLILQGLLPDLELKLSFERAIKVLENE